ncbi:centrosome-associated protein cep250 [Botryosphaeria dothidea]|uniref:Centrosome-associated protein cep250 n=1 Tax=Botryosphaeria dothidea TaxID=55169 RepID=A0A8H4IPF3_9PEZI|nr:centrosome-associated protein cep250 [Botryosphaeria dothidea]
MASSSANPPLAPYVASMVEWICPEQHRPLYLGHHYPEPSCHVAFGMRCEEHTSAAFFKLRVPVALKGQARKTNIFLSIDPEHISTIHRQTSQEVSEPVRTAFPLLPNNAILQLRFALSKPATIVIPAEISLMPKSTATVNLLRLIRSLALATQFTVYLAEKGQNKDNIMTICDLACSGKLRPDPSELRLDTLYAGSGAKAVQGAELVFPFDDDAPPESPPSYDELAGPPPSKPANLLRSTDSVEPPRKRSRLRSNSPKPTTDDIWRQELQEMRKQLKEEMRQEIREELRQNDEQWQAKMQEMREQIREEMAQQMRTELERLQSQHASKLLELEELIDERVESFRGEFEDMLEDNADETSGIVDIRIDERIMGFKDELRDYVAEEVKNSEDWIRSDLENGGVSIRFNSPRR